MVISEIVKNLYNKLNKLERSPIMDDIKTSELRKLAASLFRDIKDKTINEVFDVCYGLLEERNWELGVIAYDIAYRMRNQYDEKTFFVFEDWLIKYITGWGDCDDFCTHAFGELICQKPELVSNLIPLTKRVEFWVRRGVAVMLIPSIRQNKYRETKPFQICDLLMFDEHKSVLQGYGWTIKELSRKEPKLVCDYLLKHKAVMPRLAYRHSMQRMDKETQKFLMS
jgi:3-methyladenine DNA glycosylase AlkD